MSDTVKLIIEIDKRAYKACQELRTNNDDGIIGICAINSIANGTPLDNNSERAEVQAYFDGEAYGWEQGRKALIDDVKAEIDEQYDRVRPYNIDVAQGLEMALDILDNIGKADKRSKIRCNTCKNNNDELSGECYECIKGIFDHYEAESEDKE